jgi:hypothetical protein
VFQQDEKHLKKLLATLDQLEEWRKEEMEKDNKKP